MMIILGQRNNKTWYRNLISKWDKNLFPGKTNDCADNDSEEDSATREVIGTSAVTDLMRRMKVAGSNTISESDSESSSSSDSEKVVPQHNSNTYRHSSSMTEGSDDEHAFLPRAPLPPSLPPQPQPQPRPTAKTSRISNDDLHIISYATSLPLPPRPQQITQTSRISNDDSEMYTTSLLLPPRPRLIIQTSRISDDDSQILSYATSLPPPPRPWPIAKTSRISNDDSPEVSLLPPPPLAHPRPITKASGTSDDDSHIISYATSLPPPPRSRPSAQNLRIRTETTNNNVTQHPIPARLKSPSPALDSEPLRQAQNVDTPSDSPLSELADTQFSSTSRTQSAVPAPGGQNSKVRKSKPQKQGLPGPARRSGRTKVVAGLNAAEEREGSQKGKGQSCRGGNWLVTLTSCRHVFWLFFLHYSWFRFNSESCFFIYLCRILCCRINWLGPESKTLSPQPN